MLFYFLRGLRLRDVFFAALASFFSSFAEHSKLGHSFQGPRAVVTITMGAPHASHTSSVGVRVPCCGSG